MHALCPALPNSAIYVDEKAELGLSRRLTIVRVDSTKVANGLN
jgi:hypothetical protein